MSKAKSALLLCATLVLSMPAFAVDGVVLINQSVVLAAGGFPYTIAQPGSYRLSGNLVVPAGVDGIDINVGNVTLDLNGFTISGPGSCTITGSRPNLICQNLSGSGISSLGPVTIRNGTVTGFASGVHITGFQPFSTAAGPIPLPTFRTAATALVEEIQALDNGEGISVSSGSAALGTIFGSAILRRNVASFNQKGGIFCDFGGSGSCVISDNAAQNNGDSGIFATDATITGNVATNNDFNGIDTLRSTITGNVANFNLFDGLEMRGTGLYGSNMLVGNGDSPVDRGVSQNNNACAAGLGVVTTQC